MSTIRDPRSEPKAEPIPGPEDDPFRYGYRPATRIGPDGRSEWAPTPLTLHDLLFPMEEDRAWRARARLEDCFYLMASLQQRTAGDPHALVLCDHRIRFDAPGLEPMGPDVAAFFGVTGPWRGGTFDVAATGARPALVIEVTSPSTRAQDFGEKKQLYHQAQVPLYVIADVKTDGPPRQVQFSGFRRAAAGYEPIPNDAQGRIWLEPFDLWLAMADDRILCIDGRTGRPIPHFRDIHRARDEAEAHAAEAQARADRMTRTLTEAEAARAQAEAEAIRAREALAGSDARMRAMEAELRRLKGEG